VVTPSVEDLLRELHARGVKLWLQEGNLRSRAPEGAITPALRSQISSAKQALVEYLQAAQGTAALPSVDRTDRDASIPLSFAQQRLWFLNQLEDGASATYNMPFAFRLNGELDVEALEESLNEIVRRHESLRTTYRVAEGRHDAHQVIKEHTAFRPPLIDVPILTQGGQLTAEAERLALAEARRPFDLSRDVLLRAALLRAEPADSSQSPREHILLLTMHHIASDIWSVGVLVRELSLLYRAFHQGAPSPLPELPIQYADFASWQRRQMQERRLNEDLGYWRQQLAGAPPLLELPSDRPRPPVQTFDGGVCYHTLSPALTSALKTLSIRSECTLFMTLLAAFNVLLMRLSGQEDLVIGTPIAGRTQAEVAPLIGSFVNALVLRTNLSGNPPFQELLKRVRTVALDAYRHQELPFEALVEALKPPRSLSYPPLYQVMFALQNVPLSAIELPGVSLSLLEMGEVTAKFDLHVSMLETEQGIRGVWIYNKALFDGATVARMVSHFETLLAGIVNAPDLAISALPILREDELHRMRVEWNATAMVYPKGKTIHQCFEEQVKRSPEAIALSSTEWLAKKDSLGEGDGPGSHKSRPRYKLSYRQLDDLANLLARYLRSQGVGTPSRRLVGLHVERSVEMAVALLGVLKAGGAYVPLDPSYPKDRIAFMMADAGIELVLTQASLRAKLAGPAAQLFCLDADWDRIAVKTPEGDEARTAVTAPGEPDEQLAYVIYTSGSSGRPKGVQVGHRSVVNLLSSMRERPGLSADDATLAITTISFDIAALELFLPWTVGAEVVLASREIASNGRLLGALLDDCGATVMQATPATWRMLLASGWQGKRGLKILCGGEALPRELATQLRACGGSLWNMYGPTETTIWSAIQEVATERPPMEVTVPIGRPIGNTQLYVLDRRQQLVPVGVAGELHIGGDGQALGYLGRSGLTAEKFIPNPFGAGRIYRTGDSCRYLPDGTIEFLGRLDHQVKVQGFRIELGEIEAILNQHPSVQTGAVIVRDDHGDKRLVAYVVPEAGTVAERGGKSPRFSPVILRSFLEEKLPAYMVPSSFVALDALPLTPNGKLDRAALPAPDTANLALEAEYVAPRTHVEEALCAIWRDVLGVERVGVHDNFFTLGGHSLLATQVASRIRLRLQIELPLQKLFVHLTVAALAKVIEQAQHSRQAPIKALARSERLPLSFAQQRLWFLSQLEGASATYNMPAAARLTGELDVEALAWSLDQIVQRHESLRTNFLLADGEARQLIREDLKLDLKRDDLSHLTRDEQEREITRIATMEAQAPFDLTRDLMVRARLISLRHEEPQEHVLVLVMHHIASDGWSLGVFFRELSALYMSRAHGRPYPLAPLPIQYADFAHFQRQWLRGDVLSEQLTFWRKQLSGAPSRLELPTDHPRPALQSFRGRRYTQRLSPELSRALASLSRRYDATLFMTLLSAFNVLLMRYSGQTDIVVGTTIANRTRVEIEPLIGFFVNTLALRTNLSDDPSFAAVLSRVKDVALDAYRHQDLPFEMLVEELQPERDLSHPPLFQVLFALQNAPMDAIQLERLTLTPLALETNTAKFDLILAMTETKDGLSGQWEYSSDLFEPETIERLAKLFETLLTGVAAHPEEKVQALPLIGEAERRQLLVTWNDTRATYPNDKCVHQLFEEQAARTPDAPAVVTSSWFLANARAARSADDRALAQDREEHITYRQLNERANQLAHYLRSIGVGPEALVGICLERSPLLLVGILGILKAGGAYLPLDPSYPRQRLSFMLEDAKARVLLTQQRLRTSAAPSREDAADIRVICLDTDWRDVEAHPRSDPPHNVGPDGLAYVIYTSGSTGKPKGVMIVHRGLTNYLSWCIQAYDVASGEGAPVHSAIGFDATITSLFSPLLVGKQVTLIPEDEEIDQLAAVLSSGERFSLVKITPAHLQILGQRMEKPEAIGTRVFVIGGEALFAKQLAFYRTHAPASRLINEYGPTECVVGCCAYEVPPGFELSGAEPGARPIPIGRPIANAQVYVLDQHLQPVPIGVVGELYVGGDGVARGYLDRPELTEARFIPNPFGQGRLYRTGDLVRYLADANLEFMGRADQQVKIRGHRIELGEIEAVLATHPAVREAAVTVREAAPGDQRLTAYLTLAAPGDEAQAEHVSDWRRLYAQTYGKPAEYADPNWNLAGWNSSYTGQPIPTEEMADWVRHRVDGLRALNPSDVLEIGCGTGLLLSRLAPHCRRYVGTDFSQEALNHVQRLVAESKQLESVTLSRRAGDELADLEAGSFDLVIINSVVQYFPSLDYLMRVLKEAVRVLRPRGRVFIGDVRSFALLPAFHTSIELHHAPDQWTREQLAQRIQRQLVNEEELLIDPEFFRALPHHLSGLAGVEIALQRGRYLNELTRFRYEVILQVCDDDERAAEDMRLLEQGARLRLDWHAEGLTRHELRRLLNEDRPERLCVIGIPNARLDVEVTAMSWLREADKQKEKETVAELRRRCSEGRGVDPEELWSLEQELPYAVHVTWSQVSPRDGAIDAIFCRRDQEDVGWRRSAARAAQSRSWQQWANNPLLRATTRSMTPQWRRFLEDKLPEYMIPAVFVPLDELPLTPNGKIDRRALPAPEGESRETLSMFPRSARERALIQIWEEVLGVRPVGVHDDFFELGGHSLLAVRLMARVQQRFNQNLPLSVLFQHSTVSKLASFLGQPIETDPWSPLVAIQPHGSKPPFFCVPGAGGNVTYLYWLARHLGREQPFYGLQAVGLNGITPPHTTVEAAAAAYVAEIRRIRPHGPYYLGAHSYGGKIAFEMAQLLIRAGEAVGLLALFDSGPPREARQTYKKLDDVEFMGSLIDTVGKVMGRVPTVTREMLQPLSHDERLLLMKGSLEEMGVLAPDTDLQQARGLLDVFRINEQTEYFPAETTPLPITFFAAREQDEAKTRWMLDGWSAFGSIEEHHVPGTHVALLSEPHVRVLADKLSLCLAQAMSRSDYEQAVVAS
jgi:amino acid adenylation domain-containing protein